MTFEELGLRSEVLKSLEDLGFQYRLNPRTSNPTFNEG